MLKVKRRRKASILLVTMASMPLVSGVSLQELGLIPIYLSTGACQAALSSNIPECTMDDFTLACSTGCESSIAAFTDIVSHACAGPLLRDLLPSVVSSTDESLLCANGLLSALVGSGTPAAVTTTIYTTTTTAAVESAEPSAVSSQPADTTLQPQSQLLSDYALTASVFFPAISSSSLLLPLSVEPLVSASSPASSLGSPSSLASYAPSSLQLQSLPSSISCVDSAASSPSSGTLVSKSASSLGSVNTSPQPIVAIPALSRPIPAAADIQSIPISPSSAAGPTSGETPVSTQPSPLSTSQASPVSSWTTFMLAPTTPPLSASPSPIAQSSPPPISTSKTAATANGAEAGGLFTGSSSPQRTKPNTASIVGGIVGGGIGAIAGLTVLIYICLRRQRRNKSRRISSWDFIDQRRARHASERASGMSIPPISYFDQPYHHIVVPQHAQIKRINTRNSKGARNPRRTAASASQYSISSTTRRYEERESNTGAVHGNQRSNYNYSARKNNPNLSGEGSEMCQSTFYGCVMGDPRDIASTYTLSN